MASLGINGNGNGKLMLMHFTNSLESIGQADDWTGAIFIFWNYQLNPNHFHSIFYSKSSYQ